jgi:hypothetical protein
MKLSLCPCSANEIINLEFNPSLSLGVLEFSLN